MDGHTKSTVQFTWRAENVIPSRLTESKRRDEYSSRNATGALPKLEGQFEYEIGYHLWSRTVSKRT